VARLDASDEVVALMAAQMLGQKRLAEGLRLNPTEERRVVHLLSEARRRPWFDRAHA
jgi:urease gamma subunit